MAPAAAGSRAAALGQELTRSCTAPRLRVRGVRQPGRDMNRFLQYGLRTTDDAARAFYTGLVAACDDPEGAAFGRYQVMAR